MVEEVLSFRSSQGRPASLFTRNLAHQVQYEIALALHDLEAARELIGIWLEYIRDREQPAYRHLEKSVRAALGVELCCCSGMQNFRFRNSFIPQPLWPRGNSQNASYTPG